MKNKSFTLIELLVVIAIIGILSGVILVSTSSSTDKARFAKAQAFSTTTQTQLGYDMVSEWKFDNLYNLGEDTWGSNDGTLTGTVFNSEASGSCASGGCLTFDGGDDYFTFDEPVRLTYNNFTISWWMKRFETDYECIFAQAIGAGSGAIEVDKEVNKIRFESFTNNIFQQHGMTTNLDLTDGKWHHFAIISSPTNFKLYSDGIQTFTTGPNTNNVDQLFKYVGVQQSQVTYIYGDYFEGYIDDIRMYNSALPSSQVIQQYISGLDSLLSKNLISKEEYIERVEQLGKN